MISITSDVKHVIQSVSFLPENRLLLATTRLGDSVEDAILSVYGHCPVLEVYDLDRESASQHEGVPTPIAVFSLEVGDEFDSNPMEELHYYLNIHSYSDEAAVPFFSSPSEQLVALRTNSFPHQIKSTGC